MPSFFEPRYVVSKIIPVDKLTHYAIPFMHVMLGQHKTRNACCALCFLLTVANEIFKHQHSSYNLYCCGTVTNCHRSIASSKQPMVPSLNTAHYLTVSLSTRAFHVRTTYRQQIHLVFLVYTGGRKANFNLVPTKRNW